MLAYVFWHQPKTGVEAEEYEGAQREFHALLDSPSACFRIAELPFGNGVGGYEDWYLVESWTAMGELNARAVDERRDDAHGHAASLAAAGWGAIYELVRGTASIPEGTAWVEKPRGEPATEFAASLPHKSIWRRQLVLGPAAEFCGSAASSASRIRL